MLKNSLNFGGHSTLKEIEEYKRKQKELIKEKEGLKEEVDKINRENKAKET